MSLSFLDSEFMFEKSLEELMNLFSNVIVVHLTSPSHFVV